MAAVSALTVVDAGATAESVRLQHRATSSVAAAAPPSPGLTLQRALALLAPEQVDARYRHEVAGLDPREATLVLRDLAATRADLHPADRRVAQALLARPTDGPAFEGAAGYGPRALRSLTRFCERRFCIHWVRKGPEKPSLRDRSPRNGRPDYVDKTIDNMRDVWRHVIGRLGYDKPRSDRSSRGHRGGNPTRKIDIFIANIGDVGLYGYCTTDDPRLHPRFQRRVSAFCVIDDDFRRSEFPTGAARNKANKVTLAHEFFHAVQFGYDFFDQLAMMEGTATWIEDEVFNRINDNRQYFPRSPLGPNPSAALDLFATSGQFRNWQYGTWIFYRFLAENLGENEADLPLVVRRTWERATGRGSSRHGFGAIKHVLSNRGTRLLEQMTTFGHWNVAPESFYREGHAYPTPGMITTLNDAPLSDGGNIEDDIGMNRRSNRYLKLYPAPTLGPGSSLTYSNVSIPTGGSVIAVVIRSDGSVDAPVPVAEGTQVAFDAAGVARVVTVFTNAASRGRTNGQFHLQAVADDPAP